jgi:hypothetical protein
MAAACPEMSPPEPKGTGMVPGRGGGHRAIGTLGAERARPIAQGPVVRGGRGFEGMRRFGLYGLSGFTSRSTVSTHPCWWL